MIRALFICSRNLRSPSAEQLFGGWPGVQTDSAGLAADAEVRLSAEQLDWATLIFVMEKAQRSKLQRQYRHALAGEWVLCLDIPDDYGFMQAELVAWLHSRAGRYLR